MSASGNHLITPRATLHPIVSRCALGLCDRLSLDALRLPLQGRRQYSTCQKRLDNIIQPLYQFHPSSSSSFSSAIEGECVWPHAGCTTSGNMARPRAVLPASSSSSSSDCAAGARTGATFAVDAGASAEIIVCDTSESSTEARFWPFENLDKQRTRDRQPKGAHTVPLGSTYVCPLCSSASLDPTESTQPCAASPRFAPPSPIAPRG